MRGVRPAIPARASLRDTLLVTRKLDEAAEILLTQAFQNTPDILDVAIVLHQANLVHRVGLKQTKQYT